MEWHDRALVLTVRPHGESHAILNCLTEGHGRVRAYVPGGTGRRLRGVLQPGNEVDIEWRARTEDQLGRFRVEAHRLPAGLILTEPSCLAVLASATQLIADIVPEAVPHSDVYHALAALTVLLEQRPDPPVAAAGLVRLELGLLSALGYGLDLSRCAATGDTDDLIYVSPKSARAVSRAAGAPYKDRLLPLPAFLLGSQAGDITAHTAQQGLQLTGYFLERLILRPTNKVTPMARQRVLAGLNIALAAHS